MLYKVKTGENEELIMTGTEYLKYHYVQGIIGLIAFILILIFVAIPYWIETNKTRIVVDTRTGIQYEKKIEKGLEPWECDISIYSGQRYPGY